MAGKVYPDWVQEQKTTGTTVKKVGNNYYLYKHSSKRVPGKKNPGPVDIYIGKITPAGIERSGSKKVDTGNADVIVKEYGFSRSVELLCPAGWKEPLGKDWQKVLDFLIVRESPESYIPQVRKVAGFLNLHVQPDAQKTALQRSRKYQSYSGGDGMKAVQEERPHVVCVGRSVQVRAMQVQDSLGNDITPSLAEFLKARSRKPKSRKQPKPADGDGIGSNIQQAGLVSNRKLTADELMRFRRQHWAVENSLHHVLDGISGEDRRTIRLGRNTMAVLRRCAYNITRLLQMEAPEGRAYIPDVIDDICGDLGIGLRMVFKAIPSQY